LMADAAARLLYPQRLRLPLTADEAAPPPPGFADHAVAVAWLEAERANLVALVVAGAEQGQPLSWRLADTLRGYFWLSLHVADWLTVAEAGLAGARGGGGATGGGRPA